MEQSELEQIIERARIDRVTELNLCNKQLATIPDKNH